jgi:hypothetical protein
LAAGTQLSAAWLALVAQALNQGKRLFKLLWLRPDPDPQPVFASAKQAAQPIVIISTILFLT